MRRVFPILWLSLAVGLPAVGEEISLKDGTKIVGHMTALSPDKVEVETSYGKMLLKRNLARHDIGLLNASRPPQVIGEPLERLSAPGQRRPRPRLSQGIQGSMT